MNQRPAPRLEDVDCPLGCPRQDTPVLTGRDLLHGVPGEFSVVRCAACGLMRTNPRPAPESMGLYYPADYGPYLGSRVEAAGPARRRSLFARLLGPLLRFNTEELPALPPGRMLEVGCASGAFLHRMAQRGWQVQGIEYSDGAAQAARALGYPVHTGSLETAPAPDAPVDLVVGWMVLEHLHDPVAGLRKLRACAKQGAWLVLSVPNAGSFEFRVFRRNWYALQLPTHLQHFTPRTLDRLLAAGGWKMEKVFHQRILGNLVASLGYVLRDRGFARAGEKLIAFPDRPGPGQYLLYPLAWLLSWFGQTGRMTVWARVAP
ncbi:class I SAM-dependent methyltransferase [Ramlibacter montanisoli]|uniref:Class I SAM-dependent methyltransferase n=1 Tax=Ramlibacter montanisoli TaxID=2732512 RepID=A0A849K5F9_9BURK|nr:class I SAM-dependent methyltransferase [Ramlibacter montanisoli]NNU43652.1 class I SAM-dependent methyltransferase [Ramlibacter montanisoli]